MLSFAATDVFIRPTATSAVWGIRGGIHIGLWPAGGGPRGLIRIFAPYLGAERIFNFIAVEPIANGHRDLSEIQPSAIDRKQGKLMWTADTVDLAHPPAYTDIPAPGIVTTDGPASVLTLYLIVEKFDNGAQPIIKLTLRSDRPHEVGLQTFAATGSAAMQSCVLTATMGNYSRLRHLHFKDCTLNASDLFHGRPSDVWDFYPWVEWPASALSTVNGQVSISATGDVDRQPVPAEVPPGWHYEGRPAVQTWSTSLRPGVMARVNGRATFWGTHASIPGGPAFENFELLAPFISGGEFRFAVDGQH